MQLSIWNNSNKYFMKILIEKKKILVCVPFLCYFSHLIKFEEGFRKTIEALERGRCDF